MPFKLSVAIITYNEENNIARCLKSIADLAEEIMVIDSGSADRTTEIARNYGAKVEYHPWPGHVKQKNFALQQSSHEWVLSLDADEVVSRDLQYSIQDLLTGNIPEHIDGYAINRLNYYLGNWIYHAWYPEWRLRLVKRSKAMWMGSDPHDWLHVPGKTGKLSGHLLHYSYTDLNDHFQRTIKYARIGAEAKASSGRVFRGYKLLFSPWIRFFKVLILRQAWRDGWRGWLIAFSSMTACFVKHGFLLEKKLLSPDCLSHCSSKKEAKPLHVALVHPHYRPDGGAERMIVNILQALQKNNSQITIVSRHWMNNSSSQNCIQFLKCNPFYLGRLWRDWSFSRRACKLLQKTDVNLILSQARIPCCHVYRTGGGVHREWLKQRDRILGPFRRLASRLSLFHLYKKYTERKMYENTELRAVMCNSDMVRKEIQSYYNLPEDKLHVIRNFVDTNHFCPVQDQVTRQNLRHQLNIKDSDIVYLFVGSGFERKGLDILLECLADLPTDSHLIVVGKDKGIKGYKKKCVQLNISARAHFLGVKDDVAPYYRASDVFVLPTLYDSFALTVLEAMACALPVVSSNKCGAAVDLINHETNGFVCDALDRKSIFGYLYALRSPTKRTSIGNAARNKVANLNENQMRYDLQSLLQIVSRSFKTIENAE